ncbi:hypothetical protein [Pedococcus bigeumensis]|uniref:Uncharacterized protein n=1 Tax=Pedococcus bigeumensis TaxID=433644 RepID=A0A502CY52_9MICO|nr:hypothetical protein [Pedococcus bigeumensis]TPG18197.1 hypothetical protein EAH86_07370 [Pedococcus bigeumensis]
MGEEDPQLRAARRFLDEIDARALTEEAAEPHSVITFDPMTESYLVKGPYPDAHIATLEAERLKDELNAAAGHPDYPPITTWIGRQLLDDHPD